MKSETDHKISNDKIETTFPEHKILLNHIYFHLQLHLLKTYPSTKFRLNPRSPLNIIILGDKKVDKTNIVSRFYAML